VLQYKIHIDSSCGSYYEAADEEQLLKLERLEYKSTKRSKKYTMTVL
jgi:hypothetical protein